MKNRQPTPRTDFLTCDISQKPKNQIVSRNLIQKKKNNIKLDNNSPDKPQLFIKPI
jgi:hypothetical protein